ncbi:MAG: TetR/AcrR family transcriptional regulator [Gammaproteobacteria bacterium]|nr:TetR/AcrR family transcriptional regulator [Gammaproteobacteria bacterium]
MATELEATRFQLQKDRMLRAAARCFNQKGFSGTSLKDVSALLGLTDAALYYYVRNKEELVYLCYVRAADLGREAMMEAQNGARNGHEIMLRYLRNHIEMMVGERGPIAIMSEVPSLDPAHREEVLELSRRHSIAFEEILRAGIRDGSISDCNVRMTGNAIMGSINWIPKWFHGDPEMAQQLRDELPEILALGLKAD